MNVGLAFVLTLVACGYSGPAHSDAENGPGDSPVVVDTGTRDSAADSLDSAPGETGDPEKGDSADTSESLDTGDGIAALEFDLGTIFDGRVVGDEAGAASSYHDGPHLTLGTGDVDGDGNSDLVLGMPCSSRGGTCSGAVFVVRGPVSGSVGVGGADAIIVPGETFEAGFSLASGDVDGDGTTDVLVGSPLSGDAVRPEGRVFLYLAPRSGALDGASADAVVTGSDDKQAGWSVAVPGDLDGDGRAEFGWSSWMFPTFGAVFLYDGSSRGTLTPDDAFAVISGSDMGSWFGSGGDQDGDGLDDLLVAQDVAPSRQLLLYHGPLSGALTDSDADVAFTGVGYAGDPSAVGDFNGDGYLDTAMAEPTEGSGGNRAGAVFLWYGPVTADTDVTSSDASIYGDVPEAMFGSSLSTGDIDGDRVNELLVGAPGWLGTSGGHAWLFAGPLRGTTAIADAWAHFAGDGDDAAGYATALDDVDGDGLDDVIIGAPWDDAGATHGGTVWIRYATSL